MTVYSAGCRLKRRGADAGGCAPSTGCTDGLTGSGWMGTGGVQMEARPPPVDRMKRPMNNCRRLKDPHGFSCGRSIARGPGPQREKRRDPRGGVTDRGAPSTSSRRPSNLRFAPLPRFDPACSSVEGMPSNRFGPRFGLETLPPQRSESCPDRQIGCDSRLPGAQVVCGRGGSPQAAVAGRP